MDSGVILFAGRPVRSQEMVAGKRSTGENGARTRKERRKAIRKLQHQREHPINRSAERLRYAAAIVALGLLVLFTLLIYQHGR